MDVVVRTEAGAVAREAAERVAALAADAVSARGRFSLVLAGGSTPLLLYEQLASAQYAHRLDWSRIEVFFGDERCVPPDHEWSNYRMARGALLDRVPLAPQNIHRIAGELPGDEAAAAYARAIQQAVTPVDGVPGFDLILLGMGDDGHTASLFPGMPALEEKEAWVVGTPVPAYVRPQVSRVTLTLPALNAAREVLFLVTGESKAESVRNVLSPASHDPAALPAARVRPRSGHLAWLLDEAAASRLEGASHG